MASKFSKNWDIPVRNNWTLRNQRTYILKNNPSDKNVEIRNKPSQKRHSFRWSFNSVSTIICDKNVSLKAEKVYLKKLGDRPKSTSLN
jgi:hypothetical protein